MMNPAALANLARPACDAAPSPRPRHRHRGFSFAEVMFAVVILGVGFIMVAGIFPVAIQQNQTTNEESEAASAAREAANTISSLPQTVTNVVTAAYQNGAAVASIPGTYPMFPPTVKNYTLPAAPQSGVVAPPAVVVPFSGARWDAIRNSLISTSDPRFAYVPFYKRENGASVAQLIVVAVGVRNRPIYEPVKDIIPVSSPQSIMLFRSTFPVDANYCAICPDTVTLPSGFSEGQSVNVLGGAVSAGMPYSYYAGRSYLLGFALSNTQFDLEPANALAEAAGTSGTWGSASDVIDTTGTCPSNATYGPFVVGTATLQPVAAYATVYRSPASIAGRITLSATKVYPISGGTNTPPPNAAPGAFVIVADDYPYATGVATSATVASPNYVIPANYTAYTSPADSGELNTARHLIPGQFNGRIFRLGAAVPVNTAGTPPVYPGTYELDPAYGIPTGVALDNNATMIPAVKNGPWSRVYLVGMGRTSPPSASTSATDYSGAAQDVSVYTTFIPVQ
jgi:type II secretory pathway pseudopilin PulG